MKYICHKRARFDGISRAVNIPYGSELERRGDYLYYNGRQLCTACCERAHKYFKRDDDGEGITRGKLTEDIEKKLETRDAEYQMRWSGVWSDPLCNRYRNRDYDDVFIWGNEFYEAEIGDLLKIAKIVGVKMR